eukprot:GHRQ01030942.1.p1 GENE.GHRQ01030942.1~~GHRQ01030942.1.p1  ORF type:complete len:635 (+),score=207.60 GHRQ01030942.1:296-2200(+)
MPLLHGALHVFAYQATNLAVTRRIQAVGCLKRYICCGMLPELSGSCDPYLCLDIGSTRRLRTRFIVGTHNPDWHEQHEVYVADEAEQITLEVKDADVVGSDFLGQAVIPVADIINGQLFDKWLDLTDTSGQPLFCRDKSGDKQPSRVHISIQYKPVGSEDLSELRPNEVPRIYFPQRPGNKVTLYHDAVCTPGPVPGISLAGGGLYSESSCWDDIYVAIQQAERFVWITGWSIWTDTMLQRQPASPANSLSLGELLVQKAQQGVGVLLLVWDDTTNNMPGLGPGVMGTSDEKTNAYFKDTEVTCVLCPRQGGVEDSLLQKVQRGNMFTHHQKTVIVDTALTPGHRPAAMLNEVVPTRRMLAFVGGLDLTNGRYDYPSHPLFDTCAPGGPHCTDMYQGCVESLDNSKPCPREPWHDIHARVEGPAAVDVAVNFIERWVKQAGARNLFKLVGGIGLHHRKVDVLIPEGLQQYLSAGKLMKGQVKDLSEMRVQSIKHHDAGLEMPGLPPEEAWSVQLFRTIDSSECSGALQNSVDDAECWTTCNALVCCSFPGYRNRDDCTHARSLCLQQLCAYLHSSFLLMCLPLVHFWIVDLGTTLTCKYARAGPVLLRLQPLRRASRRMPTAFTRQDSQWARAR